MEVDQQKCVACSNCVPICPMGAIFIDPAVNRATVNLDECVECFTCYRGMSKDHLNPTVVRTIRGFLKLLRIRFDPEPDVCPTDALTPQELTWPRVVRRAFSDPLVPHESTGVHGRGTDEVKTNEVTGRYRRGRYGMAFELGRPSVGARFHDVQKVATAVAALGIAFEENNPVTRLMVDRGKGLIKPEVLDEKVLSAIVEFMIPTERLPQVLDVLDRVPQEINTVFSGDIITRVGEDGSVPYANEIRKRDRFLSINGKSNVGLGRPLAKV